MDIPPELVGGGLSSAGLGLIWWLAKAALRRRNRREAAEIESAKEMRKVQERTQAIEREAIQRDREAERADRRAERDSCEARFVALAKEIKEVRDRASSELTDALRESLAAIAAAAESQREGNQLQRESNTVLNRVCRRLEGLPCAKDAADSTGDKSPLNQAAIKET